MVSSETGATMTARAASLHPADYGVFGVMLFVSLAIGLYHSRSGGRQRTTSDYHLGDRKLGVLPVAVSSTVTFLHAVTVLGIIVLPL